MAEGSPNIDALFAAAQLAADEAEREQLFSLVANSSMLLKLLPTAYEELVASLGAPRLDERVYVLADVLLYLSCHTHVCVPQLYRAVCTHILSSVPRVRHRRLRLSLTSVVCNLMATGPGLVDAGQLFSTLTWLLRLDCSAEELRLVLQTTALALEDGVPTELSARQCTQLAELALAQLRGFRAGMPAELVRCGYALLRRAAGALAPACVADYVDLYAGLVPARGLLAIVLDCYRQQPPGGALLDRAAEQLTRLAGADAGPLREWLAGQPGTR